MTGEVPTQQQTDALAEDLKRRAALPAHTLTAIKNFPKHMHPMTQYIAAVATLQTESKFAAAYTDGK
jgi:citrate synthase